MGDAVTPLLPRPDFDAEYEQHEKEPISLSQQARYCLQRKLCCTRGRLQQFLFGFFPFITVLRTYDVRQYLLGDIIAGMVVGVMNIPQGMGYAMLANMPPVCGLYVSFFAPLTYFIFGTSRHISVGTFAVVSLMVADAVHRFAPSSDFGEGSYDPYNSTNISTIASIDSGEVRAPGEYTNIEVATAVTLMTGLFQIAMYVVNLGSLTTYLSDQLVSAFTTGAAMHVFTSQLKHILGVRTTSHSGAFQIVYIYIELLRNVTDANMVALLTSVACILTLVIAKEVIDPRLRPIIKMPIPVELVVVAAGTGLAHYLRLADGYDLSIVGSVASGIPSPSAPPVGLLSRVVGDAFPIAVVAFTITVSMAKIFARKHGYEVDANQELFAGGAANVVTSCFGGFASSASLSRSAVQENVGGRTQVAGVVACALLLLVLLVVGPFFGTLPNAVLASIIIVALKGMFRQYREVPRLWRLSKPDFLIWLVTWAATVFIDVKYGLVIGVGFSLLTIVWQTQRPFIAIMGWLPGSNVYKAINVYQPVVEVPGVRIFRFEASLYFANADSFLERLFKLTGIGRRGKQPPAAAAAADMVSVDELGSMTIFPDAAAADPTRFVVVDCSMFGYIDLSGVAALKEAVRRFDEAGVEVLLSGCRFRVRQTLHRTRFFDDVPQKRLHLTIHDAILYASSRLPGGGVGLDEMFPCDDLCINNNPV
ncbi:PREDICTED: sulfate transporter-like isoform X2 [Priapulus caudatus]|uniref:Sulfate transporter-like isoform X2 n=1 Tax=Priapulus caudatus TaxID=37621 RepID=A0ABM1E0H2_PRICU|nr:PREDICTED: sulfate transporter-like isoform X2 [Priapulus caudatus]